ncbi:hypothetical protein ACP4OV_013992 [Aristida adscensionis]
MPSLLLQQPLVALAAAAAFFVVLAAAAAAGGGSSSSSPGADGTAVPSCAAKLVPCGAYLNSTATPPAACCAPLREAAANETACMCAVLANKAALQAFGVKPEQGLGLAKRCGVATDASACAKVAAATGAGAGAATTGGTASSSASSGGSASAVTKPTANGGGAAHRLSLIGASVSVGFSIMWWAIMA